MYQIERSIDISFSHHIRGHDGPCINIHGHTWKFEVALQAAALNRQGFVVDFSDVTNEILRPCHRLLDHALAVGETTYKEIEGDLESIGRTLLSSRDTPRDEISKESQGALNMAKNLYPGGLKVAVFAFSPTSERLAEWLYRLASERLGDSRVQVAWARVYETLHPIESTATYSSV